MPRIRLLLSFVVITGLLSAPALAEDHTIALSDQEVSAIKQKLIDAKPDVRTSTLMSFLAPGSAQAYMGHVDRTFLLWGLYLLGYTGIKAGLPSPPGQSGPSLSDLAVVGLFLALATASSVDAYMLSNHEREEYDKLIDDLTAKQVPVPNVYPNIQPAPPYGSYGRYPLNGIVPTPEPSAVAPSASATATPGASATPAPSATATPSATGAASPTP
ncbi:MAG TPA: hypothetical protein V6D47_10950 [Oscillatoriaceae cyanobacterium]